MATKVIGKITLFEPVDQVKLTEMFSGSDTILLQIDQNYISSATAQKSLAIVIPTQISGGAIDYVDALKKVFDIAAWQFQENAIVWNILYDDVNLEYDLSNSYVRDSKDTSGRLTSLTTGQDLTAVFITPGLNGVEKTAINLSYDETILLTDREALAAKGIVLNIASTGKLITVDSFSVPYKIEFYQPESVTGIEYVIDFNYKNKVIELI